MTIGVYLGKLQQEDTDIQTNGSHKHLSTVLESIRNIYLFCLISLFIKIIDACIQKRININVSICYLKSEK